MESRLNPPAFTEIGAGKGCKGRCWVFPWSAVGLVGLMDKMSAGAGTVQYLIGFFHCIFQQSNNGLRGIAIDLDVD